MKSAGRWDWWEVPLEIVRALGPGIPGIVARSNGRFEIHRSHLPLLADHGVLPLDGPAINGIGNVVFRPWQRRAYPWAVPRRGTVIVAEPRLGKTALALALHDPASGPLVVLAPLDVRQVWLTWIERMFPGAEVLLLEGQTVDVEAVRAAQFIFGHYDVAAYQRLTSLSAGTLIVDEAHLLANSKSQRSAAVRFFAGLAKRVVVLTGTPLWNSVKGLWPLLATANPGAWGGKPFSFNQRYCSPVVSEHGWKYGEISNVEEWAARKSEVVFQVSWRDERPDLPPARRRFVDIPISLDMAGELDMAAAALRSPDIGDSVISTIARYRRLTGLLKVPATVAVALEVDTPVVCWSWHQDVAAAVAKGVTAAGRPSFTIHGGPRESAKKRLKTIDAWRDSRNGVLSATMAVGQVGIDLSHAPIAVFTEVDWTPAVLYQAEMRTFDPDRPMEIVYPRVSHPVDQLLVDKLLEKLDRAEASAMPAAGSGFHLREAGKSDDDLLAALDAIVSGGGSTF